MTFLFAEQSDNFGLPALALEEEDFSKRKVSPRLSLSSVLFFT